MPYIVDIRGPALSQSERERTRAMDELDTMLLEAWNRVGARVRRKRISALKRSRRRFKGVLRRPMREWCLVIRASDTRIARLADWVEGTQSDEATERRGDEEIEAQRERVVERDS